MSSRSIHVRVTHVMPSGEHHEVALQTSSPYPDAVDDLRVQACKLWVSTWPAGLGPAPEPEAEVNDTGGHAGRS